VGLLGALRGHGLEEEPVDPWVARKFRVKGETPNGSGPHADDLGTPEGERLRTGTHSEDTGRSDEHARKGRFWEALDSDRRFERLPLAPVVVATHTDIENPERGRIPSGRARLESTGEQNEPGAGSQHGKALRKAGLKCGPEAARLEQASDGRAFAAG
jgi:hypothetical protein